MPAVGKIPAAPGVRFLLPDCRRCAVEARRLSVRCPACAKCRCRGHRRRRGGRAFAAIFAHRLDGHAAPPEALPHRLAYHARLPLSQCARGPRRNWPPRSLPGSAPARPGGHGRGFRSGRHRAPPPGGAEGDARGVGPRRFGAAALPSRGAFRGRHPPSARRHHLPGRARSRRALPRHGTATRRIAGNAPAPRRQTADAGGDAHRSRNCRGAGGGA